MKHVNFWITTIIYEIRWIPKFNKVFFIDLNISDFKDDNNTYILFEINGTLSTFNSTQIYINDKNDSQSEIYNDFNYCNKDYNESELIFSCNYTKPDKDSTRLMLFLNEGNKITIKNIIPEKKEIPSDEDEDEGDNDNNAFNYFYYIGIPAIVIILGIVITVIIMRFKKKKEILNVSTDNLMVN